MPKINPPIKGKPKYKEIALILIAIVVFCSYFFLTKQEEGNEVGSEVIAPELTVNETANNANTKLIYDILVKTDNCKIVTLLLGTSTKRDLADVLCIQVAIDNKVAEIESQSKAQLEAMEKELADIKNNLNN